MLDATYAPSDIVYPTDVGLLNEARETLEEVIDLLYEQVKAKYKVKPRKVIAGVRDIIRKLYLPIIYTETAVNGNSAKKKGFVYPVPDSVEKEQVKKLPAKSRHMMTPVPGMRLKAFSVSASVNTVWTGSWRIWKKPPDV